MPATPTRKRRVEFQSRDDMAPTAERRQHQDFRTTNGVTRVVSGVEILRQADDIDDDAQDAAYRWLCEFVWSQHGYLEYRNPHDPDGLKNDAISWNLTRARVGKRIQMISEKLGPRAHVRLEMLLVQELSFSRIGAAIWPGMLRQNAAQRAQAQCALVLAELPDAYRWVRDRERREAEARAQKKVLVPELQA